MISVSNKLSQTPLVQGWTELEASCSPISKITAPLGQLRGAPLSQAPSVLVSNSCATVEKSSPSANVHQSTAVEGLPASNTPRVWSSTSASVCTDRGNG